MKLAIFFLSLTVHTCKAVRNFGVTIQSRIVKTDNRHKNYKANTYSSYFNHQPQKMELNNLIFTFIERKITNQINNSYANKDCYSKIETFTKLYTTINTLSTNIPAYIQEAKNDKMCINEISQFYLKKLFDSQDNSCKLDFDHQESINVSSKYILSELTNEFTMPPHVIYIHSTGFKKNFENILDQLWFEENRNQKCASIYRSDSSSSFVSRNSSSTRRSSNFLRNEITNNPPTQNQNFSNFQVNKILTFLYELVVLIYFDLSQAHEDINQQKDALNTLINYTIDFLHYKNVAPFIETEAENFKNLCSIENYEPLCQAEEAAEIIENVEFGKEVLAASSIDISLGSVATETFDEDSENIAPTMRKGGSSVQTRDFNNNSITRSKTPISVKSRSPAPAFQSTSLLSPRAVTPRREERGPIANIEISTVQSISEFSDQTVDTLDKVFSLTDSHSTPVYIYTPPNIEDVISMHENSEISSVSMPINYTCNLENCSIVSGSIDNGGQLNLNAEQLDLMTDQLNSGKTLLIQRTLTDSCSHTTLTNDRGYGGSSILHSEASRSTLIPNVASHLLIHNQDSLVSSSELFQDRLHQQMTRNDSSYNGLNLRLDLDNCGTIGSAVQKANKKVLGLHSDNNSSNKPAKSIREIINESTKNNKNLQRRLSTHSSINSDFERDLKKLNVRGREGREKLSQILTIAGIAALSFGFVILSKNN